MVNPSWAFGPSEICAISYSSLLDVPHLDSYKHFEKCKANLLHIFVEWKTRGSSDSLGSMGKDCSSERTGRLGP